MKTRMYFIGLLLLLTGSPDIYPQATVGAPGLLPGHRFPTEDILTKSSDIVLASFISIGMRQMSISDHLCYERARLHIVRSLKGTLAGDITVDYRLRASPGPDKENTPTIGAQYILLMGWTGSTRIEVRKALPSDQTHLRELQAMIAHAK